MLNSNAKYWVTAQNIRVCDMWERKYDDCMVFSECRISGHLQESYLLSGRAMQSSRGKDF